MNFCTKFLTHIISICNEATVAEYVTVAVG